MRHFKFKSLWLAIACSLVAIGILQYDPKLPPPAVSIESLIKADKADQKSAMIIQTSLHNISEARGEIQED